MKTLGTLLLALLMMACQTSKTRSQSDVNGADAIQVMVIGTYHFVSSDSDVVSLEAKSVLDARSQSEL